MERDEAVALIGAAVTDRGGVWADLGAGAGVFTLALAALLGPAGTVYAVDRDAAALRELAQSAMRADGSATIRTIVGDFMQPVELPSLDGLLLANALHFVPYRDQPRVMRHVASLVTPGGPIVVVEYDRRAANPWVPYPISRAALATLAHSAGLGAPTVLATQPSQYSGTIYSAVVR